jgi:hypothetical protein
LLGSQPTLGRLRKLVCPAIHVLKSESDVAETKAKEVNVFAGTKSEPVVKISERYQKFFERLIYDPNSVEDDGKGAMR